MEERKPAVKTMNVLIVGDAGAGKSSMISSLTHSSMPEGEAVNKKMFSNTKATVDRVEYNLVEMNSNPIRANQSTTWNEPLDQVIFVCDLDNQASIANLKDWQGEVDRLAEHNKIKTGNAKHIIVCHTNDESSHKENLEDLKKIAAGMDCPLVVMDAKHQPSLSEFFLSIAQEKSRPELEAKALAEFKMNVLKNAKEALSNPKIDKLGKSKLLLRKKTPKHTVKLRKLLEGVLTLETNTAQGREKIDAMFKEYLRQLSETQTPKKRRDEEMTKLYGRLFAEASAQAPVPRFKSASDRLYEQALIFLQVNRQTTPSLPLEMVAEVLKKAAVNLNLPESEALKALEKADNFLNPQSGKAKEKGEKEEETPKKKF